MFEKLNESIDNLVGEIYTVDQKNFNQKFILFLDTLEELLQLLRKVGYEVDLTEEMGEIQQAFGKRDMAELADYLLYDFKPVLLELKEMTKEVRMED